MLFVEHYGIKGLQSFFVEHLLNNQTCFYCLGNVNFFFLTEISCSFIVMSQEVRQFCNNYISVFIDFILSVVDLVFIEILLSEL